ncbi:MAG: hypothetical protein FWH53_04200 [Leptospirales bacterium]|nr:hypothetical protein [Leptospirales bacterium]
MKFIKIFCINILLLVVLSATGISQDVSQIMFLNELDGKRVSTYADALRMFRFQVRTIAGSDTDSFLNKGYYDDLPLTKGMASLMISRILKLKKSLMYNILYTFGFESERYAYRACIAEKFFNADGSENDLMSGSELIELFSKVNELFNRGR